MKTIKLTDGKLKAKLTARKTPATPHRRTVDYGVPTLRENRDISQDNGDLRTGLSQPKIKKRRIFHFSWIHQMNYLL